MTDPTTPRPARPATWALALAFATIYVTWGTTYFAIKEGVQTLPPALFGGTRITLAGLVLLAYLVIRRQPIRLPMDEFIRLSVGGIIMFVAGNGLINAAEMTVDSGVAAVLVATTPLWVAILENIWPSGERLAFKGWVGLNIGLAGVLVLLAPKLSLPGKFIEDFGTLMVLGSSFAWAVGSFFLRYGRRPGSPVLAAAVQMIAGGGCLALAGLLLGEHHAITAKSFPPKAIAAFFYLLIVGSLIGFVAYSWLLDHVSATMAGTYAYVNPVIAIIVGWLLGGEELTPWIVGGMAVILIGVALVRSGGKPRLLVSDPADEAWPETVLVSQKPTVRASENVAQS